MLVFLPCWLPFASPPCQQQQQQLLLCCLASVLLGCLRPCLSVLLMHKQCCYSSALAAALSARILHPAAAVAPA
jgi:hypothetical protein